MFAESAIGPLPGLQCAENVIQVLHFTAQAFADLTPIRAAREQLAADYYELIRAEALKLAGSQT